MDPSQHFTPRLNRRAHILAGMEAICPSAGQRIGGASAVLTVALMDNENPRQIASRLIFFRQWHSKWRERSHPAWQRSEIPPIKAKKIRRCENVAGVRDPTASVT